MEPIDPLLPNPRVLPSAEKRFLALAAAESSV